MEDAESIDGVIFALGLILFVMYCFVCRVIAREIMRDVRTLKVYAVCWAVGVLVFGTFMQLTAPDNPWIAASIFVAPFAAMLGLALANR
jgi:uncharacterized membrane protein YoaK (UPF0700 family)